MEGQYGAITIAKWFLAWAEQAEEAGLSNMKLQKLLYYAQGHHLGSTGQPLFTDDLQAWSHGPVVPNVYRSFRDFGGALIDLPEDDDFRWSDVGPGTTEFLMKVWNTYGGFAAWRLRNMTHAEAPWKDNFVDGERFTPISDAALREFFEPRTRLT
jgi:uncharacterized phage-associated protein